MLGTLTKDINAALDNLADWMSCKQIKLPFVSFPTMAELVSHLGTRRCWSHQSWLQRLLLFQQMPSLLTLKAERLRLSKGDLMLLNLSCTSNGTIFFTVDDKY
ncbi:hypothetical protein Nepgr_013326 [Nepenthes gracilis]|uniref:Uncharacterized protein n=1 Tax=Nepenthes gracilis TaxID=150966 RepID=A0AAD3SIN2_NEPGR|nr:hypothetical protein Nepgr_013326 [Nepenthes gracilis]